MALPDPWDGLVTFLEATLNAQTLNRALREILTGIYEDGRDRHNARITAPFVPLVERAKAAGAIRPDAEPSDVSLIVVMLCTLADASSEQSPYLWRRYLPLMLNGLREGAAPMPVPALTPEQLRAALTARDRRAVRTGDGVRAGDGVSLVDGVSLIDGVSLVDGVRAGDGLPVVDGVPVGD
jgi:hypothetical protein